MRLRKTLLWAAAMLMLGGCSEKASDAAPAGTPAATATAAQAAPAMSPAAQPQHVAVEVPTPGKVLNDVYGMKGDGSESYTCLLYTSPSPRDRTRSRMPSSA